MAASCSPPKSQGVRSYTRSKPRRKPKPTAAKFVVVNSNTGAVVSRHRKYTAAIRERKRLDLISFRRGNGRPYETRKAA